MSHWLSSYSPPELEFFFLARCPIYPWLAWAVWALYISFQSMNEGNLAHIKKTYARRVWRDDKQQQYLDSLATPWSSSFPWYAHTLPPPSSFSPPLPSPLPLLCDDMYVLMETRCGLLRWKRRWEGEKYQARRLDDTSLTDCRRCGGGWGGGNNLGGVSRVQTVTVHIFRCPMKCAHHPEQALSEAGGFPCGYGWVRTRVAGLGEPESASPTIEVFFLHGLGKPRHVRQGFGGKKAPLRS